MENYNLYKDIAERTNGEIYIGVVGPVRTGKSTFIKRFMDILVLPEMKDEAAKERTRDELPQSAAGKTIPDRQRGPQGPVRGFDAAFCVAMPGSFQEAS